MIRTTTTLAFGVFGLGALALLPASAQAAVRTAPPTVETRAKAKANKKAETSQKTSVRTTTTNTRNTSAATSSSVSSHTRGRLGIGGLRALSGYSALRLKYFLTPKWSISGAIGFDHFNPEIGRNNNSTDMVLAPGFNYWITPSGQNGPITASFGVGGRLGIYLGTGPGASSSRSGVNVEATTTAEVFLGDHFSLAPEAGLVFRFVGNGPDPANFSDGFGISLGRNTGLFGGGSFNFYF